MDEELVQYYENLLEHKNKIIGECVKKLNEFQQVIKTLKELTDEWETKSHQGAQSAKSTERFGGMKEMALRVKLVLEMGKSNG